MSLSSVSLFQVHLFSHMSACMFTYKAVGVELIHIFDFPLEWELACPVSFQLYSIAHVVHYCGRQCAST